MLPVDSDRWSKLDSAVGNADSVLPALRQMHACLEHHPIDADDLKKAIYEIEGAWEDLYHQQSVYSGTAAFVPHLVHFAKALYTRHRINESIGMLVRAAYMIYESPDSRTDEDDLLTWYYQSVRQAETLVLEIARTKNESAGTQITLFEAVAILHGYNKPYYNIREYHWKDFSCAVCQTKLFANFDDKIFQVWRQSEGDIRDVAAESRTEVTATVSLENELRKPRHLELQFFHDLFVQGQHVYMLNWLRHLLGWFACPECKTNIQISYNGFWDEN